jgi:hypothetical protein
MVIEENAEGKVRFGGRGGYSFFSRRDLRRMRELRELDCSYKVIAEDLFYNGDCEKIVSRKTVYDWLRRIEGVKNL